LLQQTHDINVEMSGKVVPNQNAPFVLQKLSSLLLNPRDDNALTDPQSGLRIGEMRGGVIVKRAFGWDDLLGEDGVRFSWKMS